MAGDVGHLAKTSKVLIVDDCSVVVKAVQKNLSSFGFENLLGTTDPCRAFEMVLREAPDIVLLDLSMPQLDGLQILDMIREHETTQKLPVLILSAATDSETRLQAFLLGASDFLTKPIDPFELALRIRNVLLAKAHQDCTF